MPVYVLAPGDEYKVVKIGFTKGDVAKRVRQLQTGNHERLRILFVLPTHYRDGWFKRTFREYWVHGEWYRSDVITDRRMQEIIVEATGMRSGPGTHVRKDQDGIHCWFSGDGEDLGRMLGDV